MKPWMKMVIGLLVALSVIGFLIVWEMFIKERIDTVQVVVVAKEIPKQEVISREHLSIENRKKSTLLSGAILAEDKNKILGEIAAHALVKNAMISKKDIDWERLTPDESKGEAIRPIPDEWIYAKPGSLRRKDKIDIYLWKPPVKVALNEGEQEVREPEKEISIDFDILKGEAPVLQDVPVIYAKDNSNKEVVNEKGEKETEEEKRLNATGTIAALEVNLDEDEFKSLMEATKQGYLLYITYN
jgi:hypothetical protein